MNGSNSFKGMRWLKCDLHMHTPVDSSHWRGNKNITNLKKAASNYVRRCYECRLDVIGITDHNFLSKSFIPYLYDAIEDLSSEFGYSIILFPGFEINADVGKGMHVLALFDPHTNLETIDHVLTNCGVPMPRQKANGTHEPSTERLPEIIKEVQKKTDDGKFQGIIVCPHPSAAGIFDGDRISDWLQQHEWKNPELLAVEISKPINQMSGGWQSLFKNGSDCIKEWKRLRPMAAIMSSDAKALTETENKENYIGKRFSWIKMSEPSIESLRQAFLDPESRILFQSEVPRVAHTHIQSVTIHGTKFLQDPALVLSPHLNCIIGGRGSGKSMVFESMRLGLRGETTFRDVSEKDHVGARQVKRLRGTFTNDTDIRLSVFHNDLEDVFTVDNSGAPSRVADREVADAATVFRRLDALIFSQEEITQLADQQGSLLDFIDNLTRERLEEHRNNATVIIEKIKAFRQVQTKLQRLDVELAALGQEVEEIGRQLAAKTTVQAELKKHRAAQEAKRYIEGLAAKAVETKDRLSNLAEALESEPPPLGSRVDAFPNPAFYKSVETQVTVAYQQLAGQLKSAAESFLSTISKATSRHPKWFAMMQSIVKAEQQFHEACKKGGLTIEEAERLRETEQQHRMKKAARQAKQAERDQSAKELPDINGLLEKLTYCWTSETIVRRDILDEIADSATMPRTENGEAIVKTSLDFAGNRERFLEQWSTLSPPRNTRTGRMWDRYSRDGTNNNIGDALFDVFLESTRNENKIITGNPVQWLEKYWDDKNLWPEILLEYMDDIARVRQEKSDKWFELLTTRIPDAADLKLLRSDGTEAGSFQRSDLSTGQKNTAILSLLLARGTGPVLIDQPEDELDSEFLFKELVPMFRSAKQQRQLIIVTHNANIPVNSDAELVYALKAENGRGICLAQGGLDRSEVTRAVLDIMEGSEEAFRRRQEKYHF